MNNIIKFPNTNNMDTKELLKEAAGRGMDDVVIIGQKDGGLRWAVSKGVTNAKAVYLLEKSKQVFLS